MNRQNELIYEMKTSGSPAHYNDALRTGVCLLICAIFAVVFFGIAPAQAVYVKHQPDTFTQPSGEKITYYVTGDEYFRTAALASGALVMKNANGALCFAQLSNEGKLVAGPVLVTSQNQGAYQGLTIDKVDPAKNITNQQMLEDNKSAQVPRYTPSGRRLLAAGAQRANITQSNLTNVVVFIHFAGGSSFLDSSRADYYADMFNAQSNSLKSYIEAQSEGACSITSAFPQNNAGTAVEYESSHPREYYQPASTVNTLGYTTESERDEREKTLLADAVNWASANGSMPSAEQLDADSDGFLDALTFIVSGEEEDWNDLLWPHTWRFDNLDPSATINGKKAGTFTFQFNSGTNLLSTLCHESMHMLGFPDLYRYDWSNSLSEPIGWWDIMCMNQSTPQFANAYMRKVVANWGPEVSQITTDSVQAVRAPTASGNEPESYYYNMGNGERLVFEYRKNTTGLQDEDLPSSGLLVYRVMESQADAAEGNVDTSVTYADTYYIYRPGETATTNLWYRQALGSLTRATLSLNSGRTSYGSTTSAAASLYTSMGAITPYRVTDVGSTDGGTISFKFNGSNGGGGSTTGGSTTGGSTTGGTPTKFVAITFNAQNGGSTFQKSVVAGSAFGPAFPGNPTRNGYKFLGWYTAPTAGTKVTSSTVISASAAVYAHWASGAAYVTKVSRSTGTWNHAWSKSLYSPKYRTLTLRRSKSSVKIRPYFSSKAKLYVRYAGGSYKRIAESKTVKVSRGKSKTLYFKCVAQAGNSHTYKLVIKRRR